MKRKELKKLNEFVANEYIRKFEKKHDYQFDYWVADEVGGVASFVEQYFFNYDDIRYDINENLPKGLIYDWQEQSVEYAMKEGERTMSFKSYAMGLRYEDLPLKDETPEVSKEVLEAYTFSKTITNSNCGVSTTTCTTNKDTPFTYTSKEHPITKIRLYFHR